MAPEPAIRVSYAPTEPPRNPHGHQRQQSKPKFASPLRNALDPEAPLPPPPSRPAASRHAPSHSQGSWMSNRFSARPTSRFLAVDPQPAGQRQSWFRNSISALRPPVAPALQDPNAPNKRGSWLGGSRLSRASWLHVPDPNAARASRRTWFVDYNNELDRNFNNPSELPENWSFEVPDFNFDLQNHRRQSLAQQSNVAIDMDEEVELKGYKVAFDAGYDPANPHCWPAWYRVCVVIGFGLTALATGIYSTTYTSGIPDMSKELGIHHPLLPSLGLSLYLVGLALGALIMAPLSETFGRRPMYICGLSVFLVFIPVAALAEHLTTILVARFVGAFAGSVMLSNVAGSIVDITDPALLPLALSVYSFGPLNGPVLGPLIGGFVDYAWGWRALSWLSLVTCGFGALFIMSIPETYKPILLRRLAEKKRRVERDDKYFSEFDTAITLFQRIQLAIVRPFLLSFTEPVLMFWNLYISVIYAVAQLTYVSYPIIFQEIRGWTPRLSGLAFLGVFIGISGVLACEPLIRRIVSLHRKDPETGRPEPEASVSIICAGAIFITVGQAWFSLSSVPATNHWIWCMIAGSLFGFGFASVFIYGSAYITATFGMFATSASAGNLVFRSVLAAGLVFAGKPMFEALTPRTANILVTIILAALAPIPFVFYKWGRDIRQRSSLIRELDAQSKAM